MANKETLENVKIVQKVMMMHLINQRHFIIHNQVDNKWF